MAWGKRKYGGGYKARGRKRMRTRGGFRAGSGRRLRSTRFSRRSYAPGLSPESKYVDSAYGLGYSNSNAISAPPAAGTLLLDANGPATTQASANATGAAGVVGIPNGAGFDQRIGRKIFLKYMSVRMHFYWYQATTVPVTALTVRPTCRVRAMLFYDRQPNLGLPSAASVMNVQPGLTVETFQEDANRDRFVRLFDHTQNMTMNNPATPSFNQDSQATINKVIKIRGIQVYSDAGLGGVANVQTGSLFWLFMWDLPGSASAGAAPPFIDLVSRLRYSDL